MEKALIPHIIDTIFIEVEKSFSKDEIITDSVLMTLHGVFSKVLRSALDLIDNKAITVIRVKDDSLRTEQFIFQVAGSSGVTYVILHRVNYCQCKFYEERVMHTKSYPACKHFIAASLAYIWKKYRSFEIDFDAYKDIIKNIYSKGEYLITNDHL